MTFISKHITALIASLAVMLASCGSPADEPVAPPRLPGDEGTVMLDLNVVVDGQTDPGAVGSRAFPVIEDGSFEDPVTDYEKLKTLRVIIVRPDGTVEHNRYVELSTPAYNVLHSDNLRFNVRHSERKTIYLLGNEAVVSKQNGDYDFSAIAVGSQFPAGTVADLKLNATIDNSLSSTSRTYVPMSESFDVQIDAPKTMDDFEITRQLFITRSLIKFSFSVKSEVPYDTKRKLTGISVTNLADRSYYLPRATVYDPPKYDAGGNVTQSTNDKGGRLITSFELPDGFSTTKRRFPVMPYYDLDSENELIFTPYIYMPESDVQEGSSYNVRLYFDGDRDDELSDWLGTRPLAITDIPRNTHVKVNIKITSVGIVADVTLVPYTCISLNPGFGGFEHPEEDTN